ncbi:putative oxidoreductase [compost metagenome]
MHKVILIGCEGFGRLWWDILQKNAIVTAVVDINENALHKAKTAFNLDERQCYKPSDAWEKSEATIMIDCSPFQHHYSNIMRALSHNMHVLSSKPLCATAKEALSLLEMTRKFSHLSCFVIQQKRYYPVFKELKKMVEQEVLGRIESIKIELYLSGLGWMPGHEWRSRMSQPTLYEAAIHHFDIIQSVLQDPFTDVMGYSWNPSWSPFSGDASVYVLLKSKRGTLVKYDATFAQRDKSKTILFDSGWEIEGTTGVAKVENGQIYLNGEMYTALEASPDLPALNEIVWQQFMDSIGSPFTHELSFSGNMNALIPLFACEESVNTGSWINIKQYVRSLTHGNQLSDSIAGSPSFG